MKKIVQLFLCSFLVLSAYSQSMQKEEITESFKNSASLKLYHSNDKVNQSSNWYNFLVELTDFGVNMNYYRTYLFPDSTVQAEFTNGLGAVWKHSYGQVLDPHSSLFFLNSDQIETFAKYSLDSVAIPYRYRRTQKTNPDTLIIQVFIHSQLSFNPFPSGWSIPRSYARVPYDYTVRKGANPFKEITVLLTDAHEITANQGLIMVPVNVDVNPGEKIAVTCTYFPGNPFSVGDIIDIDYSPQPSNPINAFIMYDGQDADKSLDNNFYNHGSMVTTAIRYNITASTNGWEGNYIPGTAYGNAQSAGIRHMDLNFKLTYEDFTGVNELNKELEVSVVPNPASEFIKVNYSSLGNVNAVFEVSDMLGKVQIEKILSDQRTVETIGINNLSSGIYFYRIKAGNETSVTKKLMITR